LCSDNDVAVILRRVVAPTGERLGFCVDVAEEGESQILQESEILSAHGTLHTWDSVSLKISRLITPVLRLRTLQATL
jgi:hypothetical protein